VLDNLLVGGAAVWRIATDRLSIAQPVSRSIAIQNSELRRSAGNPDPRGNAVVVVGTSRALAGIDTRVLQKEIRPVRLLKLARPGLEAFQVRALAAELQAMAPLAVVFLWSEYDSHRPVRIEPVAGRGVADLGALSDLFATIDWEAAIANRDTFLRYLVACGLHTYRYRDVLRELGADSLRRFPLASRFPAPQGAQPGREPIAFWDAAPTPMSDSAVRRITAQRDWGETLGPVEIAMVREITRGRHVRVQQALLRRAVEVLRSKGIRVLVVETPLHPLAEQIYDPSLRDDFRAFLGDLTRDDDIRFLRREELGELRQDDFSDLLHIAPKGSVRVSLAVGRALQDLIGKGPTPATARTIVSGATARAGP
jgi:hypothetical protein